MDNEQILFSSPKLWLNMRSLPFSGYGSFRGIHFHNAIEIVRIDKGIIKCMVGSKTILLKQGELILINRRVLHTLAFNKEPADITYIQIDIDKYTNEFASNAQQYLYEFMNDIHTLEYKIFDNSDKLNDVFNAIESELIECKPSYESYVKAYIMYILAHMSRNRLLPDYNSISDKKNIIKIMPAIDYASKHYNTKVYLDDVCKSINIDKYYFCKLFKATLGATYIDYVNFLRIRNAEQRLSDTDDSISEIAFRCGFASIQYFNRLFKKRHGCSPKEYRKLNSPIKL